MCLAEYAELRVQKVSSGAETRVLIKRQPSRFEEESPVRIVVAEAVWLSVWRQR